MRVQLLILLALAGPFCTIARASPTELPLELNASMSVPAVTATSPEEHVVITGSPSTKPEAVPAKAATEPTPESPEVSWVTVMATETAVETTPEAAPEVVTEAEPEVATATAKGAFITVAAPAESTAAVTFSPAPPPTGAAEVPVVKTADTYSPAPPPTEAAEVPVVKTVAPTAAQKVETQAAEIGNSDVVVEEEGLSSGHVVGIVIGALIAVVIAIAVVVALVRRMGKYS